MWTTMMLLSETKAQDTQTIFLEKYMNWAIKQILLINKQLKVNKYRLNKYSKYIQIILKMKYNKREWMVGGRGGVWERYSFYIICILSTSFSSPVFQPFWGSRSSSSQSTFEVIAQKHPLTGKMKAKYPWEHFRTLQNNPGKELAEDAVSSSLLLILCTQRKTFRVYPSQL